MSIYDKLLKYDIEDYQYIQDEKENITQKPSENIQTKCSFTHFGLLPIEQTSYYCTSCDPFRSSRMCMVCHDICHGNCKKNIVAPEPGCKFVCYCGKKLHHQSLNEEKESLQPCKMKSLDKLMRTKYLFFCEKHGNNYLCSICQTDCHSQCRCTRWEGSLEDEMQNCSCTQSQHRSTEHLVLKEPIQFWLMNISHPCNEIWPLHLMNILMSKDFLSETEADLIYSSRSSGGKRQFKTIIQFLANSFQERRLLRKSGAPFSWKWNTHYYGKAIINQMFSFDLFPGLYQTISSESKWLSFRLMYIFLFLHLKSSLRTVKGYSCSDFLLSYFLYERLEHRKYILSCKIYKEHQIDKKKEFFFRTMLNEKNFEEHFEKYLSQYEVLLKIIVFMLKRLLLTKAEILTLIDKLEIFQEKLFCILNKTNDFETKFLISWRNVNLLVKIDLLIALTYNEWIVIDHLNESYSRDKEFIHSIENDNNHRKRKLLQMVIQNFNWLSLYYKYPNSIFGLEPKIFKKIIFYANETLKLFSLCDNSFYLQLLNCNNLEELDSFKYNLTKRLATPNTSETETMKIRLEMFLQDFFTSIPNENIHTDFNNLFQELQDLFTNNVKPQGEINWKLNALLSKYPHYKAIVNRNQSFPILAELIRTNFDETLSKLMIIFSDYKTSLTTDNRIPFHTGWISFHEMDIILSFFLLYCSTDRGVKYLITGKTLIRIAHSMESFSLKISSSSNYNDIEDIKKIIRIILEFWNILLKRLKYYGLDTENHKIVKTLPAIFKEMQKNYFSKKFVYDEDELKIQYALMVKIIVFLTVNFEMEEADVIKKRIVLGFKADRINFLTLHDYLTQTTTQAKNRNANDKIYLCCGKYRDHLYKTQIINSKLYFSLFSILYQGTYYIYKEHEKLYDFVYNLETNFYSDLLSDNCLCLKHRYILLRFLRTVYFIDRINKQSYTTRQKYFSRNDYITYGSYFKNNPKNFQTPHNEVFPDFAQNQVNNSLPQDIDVNTLINKKNIVEKIKAVIELFQIEIMHSINNISTWPGDKLTSNQYIKEIIFTVHFICDFFYIEKDIWYYLVFSFKELAQEFIQTTQLFVDNYSIEKKRTFDHNFFTTEMNATDMYDKDKIIHLVLMCLSHLYEALAISPKTSLSNFLGYYDQRMELNFSSYVIISAKDYEYFYKKRKGETGLVNFYREQFLNIDKTNFLELLGEVSKEFQVHDYRQFLVNYFISYMKSSKSNLTFNNYECMIYILNKMLYYGTEITEQKLEAIPQIDIKFIVSSMFQIISKYIVHSTTLAKNKFLADRLHRLTSVTKLTIEFLELLINSKYESEIFGLNTIAVEEEVYFDDSKDVIIKQVPKIKIVQLPKLIFHEEKSPKEDEESSVFGLLSSCIFNIYELFDLQKKGKDQINYEMSYDKFIVLLSNIINFFVVYIDSTIPAIKKKIFKLMKMLLQKGIFQCIYLHTGEITFNNRRNLIYFVKIQFVHLLNSFLLNGGEDNSKAAFVREFIKDFPPNRLYDEIVKNFNELLKDHKIFLNLDENQKNNMKNTYFFDELENNYMFDDEDDSKIFREAIQLKVCCKLFTLIQILEDDYGITSLREHFIEIEKKEKMARKNRFFGFLEKRRSSYELKIYLFLKRLVIKVEVKYENKLQGFYFVRPALTFHLTFQSIWEFQENVDRTSTVSKLNGMINITDYFMFEMVYNRNNFSRGWRYYVFKNIHLYIFHMLNYLFIIAHNVLVVVTYYRSTDNSEKKYTEDVNPIIRSEPNYWLGVIQAFYIIFVLYFSRVYGPIPLGRMIMEKYQKNFLVRKKADKGKKVVPNQIRKFFIDKTYPYWNELNWLKKVYMFLLSAIGNSRSSIFLLTCILLIVFYGTNHPIWIVIPAIFVVCISSTLTNILIAVYLRWWQLVTVLLFTYICIYIFMWLALFYLNDLLSLPATEISSGRTRDENFCQSTIQCLITMIDQGVRNGGGIGDVMGMVSYYNNYDYYFKRFFFVWLFHIIIILILSNVFLGIIVDTFGELRDKNNQREEDLKNVCFICQLTRDDCIRKKIVFEEHVKEEHVMWNYIYFLTFLHTTNPHEFSSLEKYVWDLLGDQDITWIPIIEQNNTEK